MPHGTGDLEDSPGWFRGHLLVDDLADAAA
jgi:hypothetical protein